MGRERGADASPTNVRCESCGWDNRDSAWYCAGCGDPLSERCPMCSTELVEEARFCDHCGAPVSSAMRAAAPLRESIESVAHDEPESAPEPEPEREPVTALVAPDESGSEDETDDDADEMAAAEVEQPVAEETEEESATEAMPAEPAPSATRIVPNLATAAAERWATAMRTADRHALATMYAPGYRTVDHALHTTSTIAQQRSAEEEILATGPVTCELELLASLGDRHALYRFTLGWDAGDGVGTVAYTVLAVNRVEPDGPVLSLDVFPTDDLARATACLVERHALNELDDEPKARALVTRLALRAADAIHDADWDRFTAQFANDAVLVDRRPGTSAVIDGREPIVTFVRALMTSSDDEAAAAATMRLAGVLALSHDAALLRWAEADGLQFLWLTSFDAEGLVDRAQLFDASQVDDAWQELARVEAGRATPSAAF